MNHEGQEASEATCADQVVRQGGLAANGGSGRGQAARARPRYRLKRSVQVFESRGESLFLARLGAGDDLEVEDPDDTDRCLLRMLGEPSFQSRELLARRLEFAGHDARRLDAALRDLSSAKVLEAVPYPTQLPAHAAERFKRQLIYFADLADEAAGPEPLQLRLEEATVALIGCGGLASWAVAALAGAGVGRMVLIDDDRVELSNLNRQVLYTEAHIGELKVSAAERALLERNSSMQIETLPKRVTSVADMYEVLERVPDLVIATGDWPPHELMRWVNRACVEVGVPWIGAGQFPPKLRVGPLVVPGETGCLECLEEEVRREYPHYDEIAAWRSDGELPDPSCGPVSAVIGSLLASECMHYLLGAFAPATVGAAISLDLRTMEFLNEPVTRWESCRTCG